MIGQNRTKCAHFRGSLLFQATYNIKKNILQKKKKKEEKTINSLSLCQLDAGRLAEAKATEKYIKLICPDHNFTGPDINYKCVCYSIVP